MTLLDLPFWGFFKSIAEKLIGKSDEFDTTDYWLTFILFAIALAITLFIALGIFNAIHHYIDLKKSTIESYTGEVIDKSYIPENDSGQVDTDEIFMLFVKSKGQIYKMEVTMNEYYRMQIGDKIDFEITVGGLTKDHLYITAIGYQNL